MATKKVMKNNEMKEQLLYAIGGAQYFRTKKAEEYPDDLRNSKSAKELQELYEYVKLLPENHSIFRWYRDLDETGMEELNHTLRRYGFDNDPEPCQPEIFIENIKKEKDYNFTDDSDERKN